jgi:hypothetical protein
MGAGVGVNVDIMATLIIRRAFCYGTSALFHYAASTSFNLVEMDGVFRSGCGVRWFLGVWQVSAASCAGGRGCCFSFHNAPALSVAIWVCLLIKQQ